MLRARGSAGRALPDAMHHCVAGLAAQRTIGVHSVAAGDPPVPRPYGASEKGSRNAGQRASGWHALERSWVLGRITDACGNRTKATILQGVAGQLFDPGRRDIEEAYHSPSYRQLEVGEGLPSEPAQLKRGGMKRAA